MSLHIFTKIKTELFSITASRNYLIAFSGGIDSCVLIQLLASLQKRNDIKIRAIYLNHSVSAKSQYWLHRCEELCEDFSIPLVTVNMMTGGSIKKFSESDLSIVRYQIIAKHILKREVLLTAHNKDDHAESILLQLVRGSGTKGMTGMPISRIVSGNIQKRSFFYLHLRPLLTISRANILYYARINKIKWIEDESNFSDIFSRNYIRIHIIPMIKSRWGYKFTESLSKTSSFCAKAELIFFKITEFNFYYVSNNEYYFSNKNFSQSTHTFSSVLNIQKLNKLQRRSRWHVICYWLKKYQCRVLSHKELSFLDYTLLSKDRSNFSCFFVVDNYVIERHDNFLLIKIKEKSLVFLKHSISYLWEKWRACLLPNQRRALSISLDMGSSVAFCKAFRKKERNYSSINTFQAAISYCSVKDVPLIVDKKNDLIAVAGRSVILHPAVMTPY